MGALPYGVHSSGIVGFEDLALSALSLPSNDGRDGRQSSAFMLLSGFFATRCALYKVPHKLDIVQNAIYSVICESADKNTGATQLTKYTKRNYSYLIAQVFLFALRRS